MANAFLRYDGTAVDSVCSLPDWVLDGALDAFPDEPGLEESYCGVEVTGGVI